MRSFFFALNFFHWYFSASGGAGEYVDAGFLDLIYPQISEVFFFALNFFHWYFSASGGAGEYVDAGFLDLIYLRISEVFFFALTFFESNFLITTFPPETVILNSIQDLLNITLDSTSYKNRT